MGDLDRAKCRCVSVYGVIIHTDGHSIREPLGAPKRGVRIVNGPADLNRRMLMGIDYERAIEKFRKWHNMNEYQEHNARRCLFYSRRSDSLNLDDDIQEKVRHERVAIGYFNMILVAESEKYIPK